MPSRKRKTLGAAVIGAAATALTVKGAMAGAIAPVAKEPLAEAEKSLTQASQSAVAASATLLHPAPIGSSAIGQTARGVPKLTVTAGQAPVKRSTESMSAATHDQLQLDPEKRRTATGSNQRAIARRILHDAALRHGLDPKLVLAVSYWESGWDQSRISQSGAVGLMQVEPYMADSAGPSLLGRTVDLSDPYDNADLGVAILKDDLQNYADPVMALAAYYEGPTALQQNGLTADAQQYADGVLSLTSQMR